MKDVKYPYCGEEQDIDDGYGYGYEEDYIYEQQCDKCEKVFGFTTFINFHYKVHDLPCANGEDHKFEDVIGYPVGYQKNFQRCVYCDEKSMKNSDLKYNVENDIWEK